MNLTMNLSLLFLAVLVFNKDNYISASFETYTTLVSRQLEIDGAPGPDSLAQTNALTNIDEHTGIVAPTGTVQGQGLSVNAAIGSTVIIQKGIDCGYRELNSGDVIQIYSRNFNVSNYYNNEACTWKFDGNRCTLSAYCPCVDFPSSPFCLEDYVRITDKYNFDQRYCGGNTPGNILISDSDSLTVKYRTDRRTTATGFSCFVSCAGPDMAPIRSIAYASCPSPTVNAQG